MPLQNLWQNEHRKTKQEIADLVQIISGTLNALAKIGDPFPKSSTVFHLTSLPLISIRSYLKRYVKYLMLDEADLIASLIILDRYIIQFPQQLVSCTNIHQLLAAIIQVVHKCSVDRPYKSSYYALLAGVSTKQMVDLEVNLLFDLGFDLFITPKTYLEYKQALIDKARRMDVLECRIEPYALRMSQSDLEMLQQLNESAFQSPSDNADLLQPDISRKGSIDSPKIESISNSAPETDSPCLALGIEGMQKTNALDLSKIESSVNSESGVEDQKNKTKQYISFSSRFLFFSGKSFCQKKPPIYQYCNIL